MSETKHSQENIAYIRTHVDNLERMVRFQISANPESRTAIRAAFEQRDNMPEVYLALEAGPLTQDELVGALKLSQPTVSRVLKDLSDAGLVGRVPSIRDTRKKAYAWTTIEEMISASKIAREVVASKLKKSGKKGTTK